MLIKVIRFPSACSIMHAYTVHWVIQLWVQSAWLVVDGDHIKHGKMGLDQNRLYPFLWEVEFFCMVPWC
jgi:hypothetical protein